MRTVRLFALIVLVVTSRPLHAQMTVVYHVKQSAPAGGNGLTWASAFNDLQQAIAIAPATAQIWVAAATYVPAGAGGNRSATFMLKPGAAIYGGFPANANDTDHDDLSDRDPDLYETTLSGDFNGGTMDDNSFHVVTAVAETDNPALLDGFTIEGGYADLTNFDRDRGGGLFVSNASPIVVNCLFQANFAILAGGGFYNNTGSPALSDCDFVGNSALGACTIYGGGGVWNHAGVMLLSNGCEFLANVACNGGGLGNGPTAESTLSNCIFESNSAIDGGAIYDSVSNSPAQSGGISHLSGCMLSGNVASGNGGAVYLGNASDCAAGPCPAEHNWADCSFALNQAFGGGAVYVSDNRSVKMVRCIFEGNAADGGGAVFTACGRPRILNCTFHENEATSPGNGGGAVKADCTVDPDSPGPEMFGSLFTNNTAVGNGGGLLIFGPGNVVNCTVYGNHADGRGGGVMLTEAKEDTAQVSNCILWANTSVQGQTLQLDQLDSFSSPPAINYCCIEGFDGTLGGIGNFGADPMFITDGVDLRIAEGSPCIDAGDNGALPPDLPVVVGHSVPADLDGERRRVLVPEAPNTGIGLPPLVDLGAYEFQRDPPADCNMNDIPDHDEVVPGIVPVLDCVLDPDDELEQCEQCPTGCPIDALDMDDNGINDVCDAYFCSATDPACQDCNMNGVLDSVEGVPGQVTSYRDLATPSGTWGAATQWCPDLAPNNDLVNQFDVILTGPETAITLNISASISSLKLWDGAMVTVDDDSGPNALALISDGTIMNTGVFLASDRERLVLDAPAILQGAACGQPGPFGVLRASAGRAGPGEEEASSIIEINGSAVIGGRLETDPAFSEIHLIGGARLENVCVQGVVVPDGQVGVFTGMITNAGVLHVAPSGVQPAFFVPSLGGGVLIGNDGQDDCVRLGGETAAVLGSFMSSFVNSSNHRIEGAGIIFGGLDNHGTIEATLVNPTLPATDQELILFSPGGKINRHVLRANGGMLRIATTVEQQVTGGASPRIEAVAGGTIVVQAGIFGNGGLLAQGGAVLFQNVTAYFGDCITEVPSPLPTLIQLSSSTVYGAGEASILGGTLDLDGASTISSVDLMVAAGAVLSIDGAVALSGSLTFANLDESEWLWGPDAQLVMTGGTGVPDDDPDGYGRLEVGGADLGAGSGFDDNFGLNQLLIGPGAHVCLVDQVYNGNADNGNHEALYVHSVAFADAAGRLNLNGLNLYCLQSGCDSGQILPNLSQPHAFFGDLTDAAALFVCFTGAAGMADPPSCVIYDLDADMDIDLNDYARIVLTGP